MIDDLIPLENVKKLSLEKSNISLPSGLRYFKKLGLIILILQLCSYRNKASIFKLQFFNWGFSSTENLAKFHKIIENDLVIPEDSIRLDPAINRTVEFALSENFLGIDNNGKILLTSKGENLYETIKEEGDILVKEHQILNEIGKYVSEKKLKSIFENIAG